MHGGQYGRDLRPNIDVLVLLYCSKISYKSAQIGLTLNPDGRELDVLVLLER